MTPPHPWQPPADPETVDGGRAVNLTWEEAEARALLGVADDAGEAEIRAAHRRLVARAHPDHGGSAELTGRLNAARDLLLRRD